MVSTDKSIKTLIRILYVEGHFTITQLANRVGINEHSSSFRRLCAKLKEDKALVFYYEKLGGNMFLQFYKVDKPVLMSIIEETETYKQVADYYNKVFLVNPFRKKN